MPQQQNEALLDLIARCHTSGGREAFVCYIAREAITALAEISTDLAAEPSEMSRRAGRTAAATLTDFARRAPTLDIRSTAETRGPTDGH